MFVGMKEGKSDGSPVGNAVGRVVGTKEGDREGDSDGFMLGLELGAGEAEGRTLTEGALVGLSVLLTFPIISWPSFRLILLLSSSVCHSSNVSRTVATPPRIP